MGVCICIRMVLLGTVAVLAMGDHLASRYIQGGGQGDMAVADVVLGNALRKTKAYGRERVDALHRVVLLVEVCASDVAGQLHKQRVSAELEILLTIGLLQEGLQAAIKDGFKAAASTCQGRGVPMAGISGIALQSLVDGLRDIDILKDTGPNGPGVVLQSVDGRNDVALAQLATVELVTRERFATTALLSQALQGRVRAPLTIDCSKVSDTARLWS